MVRVLAGGECTLQAMATAIVGLALQESTRTRSTHLYALHARLPGPQTSQMENMRQTCLSVSASRATSTLQCTPLTARPRVSTVATHRCFCRQASFAKKGRCSSARAFGDRHQGMKYQHSIFISVLSTAAALARSAHTRASRGPVKKQTLALLG